jgi:outer membrane protein TolC
MIDAHSPRMAQAVEDRRSLDRQYASQTGAFLPRIGLQLQGNHKYDVLGKTGLADDARAMVTMSYSFLNGGADIALRNRISARLRQADYELDRRRREVEQDIRADFQSLGAARQKIDTINAEIASAQRVADLYKQQFREGKRSVFDLLDSQQVLFGARTNAVGNEIAMHLAEYRVLQKLGGLFDLVSAGQDLPPITVPAPVKPSKKAGPAKQGPS